MVETGAAALAARRHTPEHAEEMRTSIADMKRFHESGDLDGFVAADIAFHDTVLKASGNPFVRALWPSWASPSTARAAKHPPSRRSSATPSPSTSACWTAS